MKAQDLRIGNLVYAPNKKDILQISRDMFSYERGLTNLEDLKPIELTEEWLLKMGFEKKSWFTEGIVIECFYYEKNGIVVYLIESGFEIEIKHREDQFNLLRVWKYLHELQNIFKIFTGEELTIK